MTSQNNIKIESLGIYLPETVLSTSQLMSQCRHLPSCDLEKITGIHERRVADGEFALDLAVKSTENALKMSQYSVEDLDMIICTSISKYHDQDKVSFEPSTSMMIREKIGAVNAITFDITNACAGMFNGIYIMESFIKSGAIKRGMVVSGEYNMPLVDTSTKEIKHSFDRQLATLTLGDGGAAIILDSADNDKYGLHQLDLITGAKHNHFCYSKPSTHGSGATLMTKARGLQRKGAEHFPFYLKKTVDNSGWTMDDIDYGIAHQVSVGGIKKGVKVLNKFLGEKIKFPFLHNVEKFGNTTSTSHFIVLHEFLLNNTVSKDHNLLFVSGASGIVITHATYTMDDLPQRYVSTFGTA
jgi:3-oxoacyl-[acyl-carrier-protein] synthase III